MFLFCFIFSNLADARNGGHTFRCAAAVASVMTLAELADVAADALDVGAGGRRHGEAVADLHWPQRVSRRSAESLRT